MEPKLDRNYKSVLDNLHDGLYIVDTSRTILFWNSSAEYITGYSAEEVVGSRCSDNILNHVDADGNELCKEMCPLAYTIQDHMPRAQDLFLHHKDGHRVPVSVRTTVITDDEGKAIQGVELFSDLTNRSATELRIRELEKIMLLDPLTKLANRMYIEQELTNRLAELERYKVPFGVLFFDIDHFKSINDTYGHLTGDNILKLVGNTLNSNARPFDLFGRWGGEEFIGILKNVTKKALVEIGNRLRLLIAESFLQENDQKIQVTISIGATMARSNDTHTEIIRRVDNLMYTSKQQGRDRLTVD